MGNQFTFILNNKFIAPPWLHSSRTINQDDLAYECANMCEIYLPQPIAPEGLGTGFLPPPARIRGIHITRTSFLQPFFRLEDPLWVSGVVASLKIT